MDKELDAKQLEEKIHDLAESMKDSGGKNSGRISQFVERGGKKHNRLERLSDDIRDVFEDLPIQKGLFSFSINFTQPQQFLIDQEAYVVTNPLTKEYELKKDTRLGTSLLGSTTNRRHMAKLVVRYVTERLLDQQRMLESELISMRLSAKTSDEEFGERDDDFLVSDEEFEYGNSDLVKDTDTIPEKLEPEMQVVERVVKANRMSVFGMLSFFLLGIFALIVGIVIAALYGNLDVVTNWVLQLADLATKNF